MSVFLGQVEGMGFTKGTSLSTSLAIDPLWSLQQSCGWRACSHGSSPWLKQNPPVHLLGAGVSQGITALSEVRRILCCAASAEWQCWHLTPNQLLLLSGSGLALTPPAWDSSPFWVCVILQALPLTSIAPCRQVSLRFPGGPFSSNSFLTS